MLSLLDRAPLAQRRPLILLASVHDLLLAGADHPLAAHYDTVAAVRGLPFRPPGTDVGGRLRRLLPPPAPRRLEHLVATRTTQTNEVGRCTSLLPASATSPPRYPAATPLSLLDLGTSAGLNLLFDDYGYTYRERRRAGASPPARPAPPWPSSATPAATSTICRPCAGPPSPRGSVSTSPPSTPRSEDEARWLLACQWPENPARFGRLRQALANVAASRPSAPARCRAT